MYTEKSEDARSIERITLDEGPIILTMPDQISKESFEDFEYWIHGIMQRIQRRSNSPLVNEDDLQLDNQPTSSP